MRKSASAPASAAAPVAVPQTAAQLVRAGYRFSYSGVVCEVIAPDGRVGHGPDEASAIQNIDAQIIPVVRPDYVGRLLIRASGEEVKLDVSGIREVAEESDDAE